MKQIPIIICHKIYDILEKHAGAPENQRTMFFRHYGTFGSSHQPTEFRICHRWGMAGKFWQNNDSFYVSGYSRSECTSKKEYDEVCDEVNEVNKLLAPLYAEFENYQSGMSILDVIPKFEQHQGSVTDQLNILYRVANKLGLHDAAEFISNSTKG